MISESVTFYCNKLNNANIFWSIPQWIRKQNPSLLSKKNIYINVSDPGNLTVHHLMPYLTTPLVWFFLCTFEHSFKNQTVIKILFCFVQDVKVEDYVPLPKEEPMSGVAVSLEADKSVVPATLGHAGRKPSNDVSSNSRVNLCKMWVDLLTKQGEFILNFTAVQRT